MTQFNKGKGMEVGELPVRVLQAACVAKFEFFSDEFRRELESELNFDGVFGNLSLKPNLRYHFGNGPIKEIAKIDTEHRVHLYENYNQFLWNLIYASTVLFDFHTTSYDLHGINQSQYDRAVLLFDSSFCYLVRDYDLNEAFSLPNPEIFAEDEAPYIAVANEIFSESMLFILFHEYYHHYLGHIEENLSSFEQRKKDEICVDNLAIDMLLDDSPKFFQHRSKLGIIICLCSFFMLSSRLDGGVMHPNLDERLENALLKVNIDDDDIWGIASMFLILWSKKYYKSEIIPVSDGGYKEQFYIALGKIREFYFGLS